MNAFTVSDVSISLDRKKATVSVRSSHPTISVLIHNFPFDPPGEQTETELRGLAIARAKEILVAAASAL